VIQTKPNEITPEEATRRSIALHGAVTGPKSRRFSPGEATPAPNGIANRSCVRGQA
jgi:hypothetical protein